MPDIQFTDALTGTRVIQNGKTGEMHTLTSDEGLPACTSLFFPGCSMINYAMPLVSAVYDTLLQHAEVDGISLLCCGKILSYEANGEEVRASFEQQLRDHLASTSIKRIVCVCPNCMKALRDALSVDERVSDIEVVALPKLFARLGYRLDRSTVARILKDDESAEVLLCPHDSCPDREFGEYADGLRDMMPSDMWVDPEHNRKRSVCCGSLPRAAGKAKAADKCADLNGREALAVSADAIVTPCMSCAFQLSMAQSHIRAVHFLELLYDWPIWWASAPAWMKVRFLFDDVLGATELDEASGRLYASLGCSRAAMNETDAVTSDADAADACEADTASALAAKDSVAVANATGSPNACIRDDAAAADARLSDRNTEEIDL